jgi:hypothetical protein
MKKFTIMGIVLFIALAMCSAYSFAESFDGFRGLKWGSAPAKGMVNVWDTSGVYTTYRRPSDALRITTRFNPVDLNAIEYEYHKNRLYRVCLYVPPSRVDWSTISLALSDRYGEPTESELIHDGVLVNERTYNQDPYTTAFLQFEISSHKVFCILDSKRMQNIIHSEKEREIQKKIGKKKTGF